LGRLSDSASGAKGPKDDVGDLLRDSNDSSVLPFPSHVLQEYGVDALVFR
jgi:hypothetical protein